MNFNFLAVSCQDEPDILSSLFQFGQNHTNFLLSMVKRFSEKVSEHFVHSSQENAHSSQDSPTIGILIISSLTLPCSSVRDIFRK